MLTGLALYCPGFGLKDSSGEKGVDATCINCQRQGLTVPTVLLRILKMHLEGAHCHPPSDCV